MAKEAKVVSFGEGPNQMDPGHQRMVVDQLLDHLGVAPGDRISVTLRPDGRAELQPVNAKLEVRAARGVLKRPGRRPVTLEEMQEAIESSAAGKDA